MLVVKKPTGKINSGNSFINASNVVSLFIDHR